MNKLYLAISKPRNDLPETALAIGFFDGLHIGHQVLIQKTLESPYKPAVLTFTLNLKDNVKQKINSLLLTEEEKDNMLSSLHVEYEYILPFNQETMNTNKETFLLFLQKINCKTIVVGSDFTFGKNASGKAYDLLSLQKNGIDVRVCNLEEINGDIVSSTRIKQLLKNGDIESANQLLSYPFSYEGEVIPGLKNGRKIGFPTANMKFPKEKVKLPDGVYKTTTIIDGKSYPSMTNIGTHPTVKKLNESIIETHILNEDLALYGKTIRVYFLKKLRDQRAFANLEELKHQLLTDKNQCK